MASRVGSQSMARSTATPYLLVFGFIVLAGIIGVWLAGEHPPAASAITPTLTKGEIFGLGEIRIDGPHSYATEGIRLKRVDGPAIVPKLGRNEPYWCESGRKDKRCHGSPSSPVRP